MSHKLDLFQLYLKQVATIVNQLASLPSVSLLNIGLYSVRNLGFISD